MYTKKQHIYRKSMICLGTFILGGSLTLVSAATYDASIQDRPNRMFSTIQSNASNFSTAERGTYYRAVRQNIITLISVLM